MPFLTEQPISLEDLIPVQEGTARSGAGAVVTFLGIVRPDRQGNRRVRALTYEAYVEMAERRITQLVAQARAQWPLEAVQVRHRLGWVEVGKVSLAIVAAARHRAEAYAASRFLIEGIKRQAPLWKREHYEDGTSQWVGCAGSRHAYV